MVGLQSDGGEPHIPAAVPAAGIVKGNPKHGISQRLRLLDVYKRQGNAGLEAELYCTRPGRTAVLAALAPGKMRISCRLGVAAEQRHAGLWEITRDVEQPGPVRLNLLPEGSCAE